MGVASLILGILALIPTGIPFIGLTSTIIGLVLGVLGRQKARAEGTSAGVATAGMVLCIIGLALSFIGLLACGALFSIFSILG